MDFEGRYNQLNNAQKQAVDAIDGPVMVIAGPGTGKTELLSMRATNILAKTDTLPENILCLTFTESGASAMRERLTQIIGPNAYKITVHTFHSFGAEIINQNSTFFYQGAHFRAADELSSYQLLRSIFDELEYDNPLASKMNDEYTHLSDTLTVISELKKSGLTSDELLLVLDANDKVIDTVEPMLAEVFANRISKNTPGQLLKLIDKIKAAEANIPLPGITSLATVIADSLETAITKSEHENSTKPITAWRMTWTKKNEAGKLILKSRERSSKLRACSFVYYQYLARMQQAELYDFDDMILRIVHALEVFPDLRFNLQEKYQYIMVDEFQDTNLAQMRILFNLTNNEVNEGRPNIMVVGDDDQAIYSFQGADVGNISSFLQLFNQTLVVPLTDNYRSSETILEHARTVITLGSDRLENHLETLDKTLTAHQTLAKSSVQLAELPTASTEHAWVARQVKALIKAGTAPSSIAVLARRHFEIEALLPHFVANGIKVNYERRDNILDQDIIQLIEMLANVIINLADQKHQDADALLPRLLSHPAFNIAAEDIWRLSLKAKENKQTWLEVMAALPALKSLQTWLLTLAKDSFHLPLERILDDLIGTPVVSSSSLQTSQGYLQPESDKALGPLFAPGTKPSLGGVEERGEHKDQSAGPASTESLVSERGDQESSFTSPIYSYYFSPEKLTEDPSTYLDFLQSLRTLRAKLHDYHPEEPPTLRTLLNFLNLHHELGSTISASTPYLEHAEDAVNLMTAHRSKGLEFDHVFITGATDNLWGESVRSRSRLISYPENLPLSPAGDSLDERLRLFFVAMTRARQHLTITYSTNTDEGKPTPRASFLTTDLWQTTPVQVPSTLPDLTKTAEVLWYQPLVQPITPTMHELLAPILENYKLSSTHLNAFLDISLGGPQHFLLHHLLKFPQAVRPSAGYGLAIHAALQRAHAHLAATGKQRPLEDILNDFESNLKGQYLAPEDFTKYLQKGIDTLTVFLSAKYSSFKPTQKSELGFANQGIRIGEARLTGSLDVVDIEDDNLTVTDYKTGKAVRNWTGRTDYDKIKLHKYRQQLMFYNLLTTHSRDYSRYHFDKGIIEFVEPTSAGELITLEATFSSDDLQAFSRLIQKVWHCIVNLDLPDISTYDPTYKGMLAFEVDLLEKPY